MKRLFTLILVTLLLASSLVGCGGPTAITSQDYGYVFSNDLGKMDYVLSQHAEDHRYNANFVDGLLENDATGKYVPALAEKWEANADATEWTFHIRKDAKWVTSTGEVYANVTAYDWVTSMQHAADFKSDTIGLIQPVIAGLDDYIKGVTTDFSTVGVKAVDEYTLVYTLTDSFSYFDTYTTYAILFPINKEFLESKGLGCALGNPTPSDCTFGAVQPDSILYSGAFILTNFTSKSVIEMKKNENYWDAAHVYINKATWTFDDGSDPYSIIKGFEAGTYSYAALRADWNDYADYKVKYADNAYITMPNSATFNVAFNYNRSQYKYTNKKTQAEHDATHKAIMNKNFRLALMFAFDKLSYVQQTAEEEVAITMLRNTLTPPDFVSTSNGIYGALIRSYIDESIFGADFDLNDGVNAFYNVDKCLEYIAKAEAEGVVFPITLDIVIWDSSNAQGKRVNSMKNSVEASTGGKIIINVHPLPEDVYYAATYRGVNGAASDWDISISTGWSADYMDPNTYLNIYNVNTGDMMMTVGLDAKNSEYFNAKTDDAMKEAGLYEYQALLDAADAIKNDNDARYDAYAKADAWLLNNAFTIPIMCSATSMTVAKIVPFTAPYAVAGTSEYKLKFMQIGEDIVKAADQAKAKEAWFKARG